MGLYTIYSGFIVDLPIENGDFPCLWNLPADYD